MLTYTEYQTLNESQNIKYDLYKKYDEFNNLYFQNSLPKINLEWGKYLQRQKGTTHHIKGKKNEADKYDSVLGTSKIVINENSEEIKVEYLEEYYDAILLHEMIHAQISYKWSDLNDKERNSHGKVFKNQLRYIKAISNNQFLILKSPGQVVYPGSHVMTDSFLKKLNKDANSFPKIG